MKRAHIFAWTSIAFVALLASVFLLPSLTTGQGVPQFSANFRGCFRDTSVFDLNGYLERSPANSIGRCATTCAMRGFKYAGAQYGESCLCGNSYGRYGAANNCNMACTGDRNQLCGGINANSVYEIVYLAQTPPPAQTAPAFLGCFRDTSTYDLNGYLERTRTNTPRQCIQVCASRGFPYAGVQYGESCLCGTSYGRYGGANNCNMACTGDQTQACGGINANMVFSTGAGGARPPPPPPVTQSGMGIEVQQTQNGVRVVWRGMPGNQFDWIALVPVGMPDSQHAGGDYWAYAESPSGTRDFKPLKPGSYEARLLLKNGYEVYYRTGFTIR